MSKRNYCLWLSSLKDIDSETLRRVFKDIRCMYITTYQEVGDFIEGTIDESSVLKNSTNYFSFRIPRKSVRLIEEII